MTALALLIAAIPLAVAGRSDIRARRVSNRLLAPLFLLGLLRLGSLIAAGVPVSILGLHIGLGIGLGLVPYVAGAYGGADAKAVMALALVTANVWATLLVVTAATALTGVWWALNRYRPVTPASAPYVAMLCPAVLAVGLAG